MNEFADLGLSEGLQQAVASMGYETPTPIQKAAIPAVLMGRDVLGVAQTGTGKTAAFAIPTIDMLGSEPGKCEVLVLAPTRELAQQVGKEFSKLGQSIGLKVATIYGGTSFEKQYEELETAHVVCATPGRLRDILERGKLDLSKLRILI